jgi:hypothetical protein
MLHGGRVFTGDRRRLWADAVAFDGSGILAVGADDDLRRHLPDAETIHLGGRTAVPGFVDAHNHFLATGESLSSIDVRYPRVASTEDRSGQSPMPPGRRRQADGSTRSGSITRSTRRCRPGGISTRPPRGTRCSSTTCPGTTSW